MACCKYIEKYRWGTNEIKGGNRETIKKAERTDGLWTIVTNTPSKVDDRNGFTEDDLIRAYGDKN